MADPIFIFFSYASEDQKLVDAIAESLDATFKNSIVTKNMSQFEPGILYRQKIDDALDRAAILLVVASEKEKLSHTFTGYEVGYFRKSQGGEIPKPDQIFVHAGEPNAAEHAMYRLLIRLDQIISDLENRRRSADESAKVNDTLKANAKAFAGKLPRVLRRIPIGKKMSQHKVDDIPSA